MNKAIAKDKRKTTPYMTKYERARVLGVRATQISQNAPVLVDLEGETDPLAIALKELKEKRCRWWSEDTCPTVGTKTGRVKNCSSSCKCRQRLAFSVGVMDRVDEPL